eukprot:scaffold1554_cov401-Prasinococcus_capsulatus_cf.AAC.12
MAWSPQVPRRPRALRGCLSLNRRANKAVEEAQQKRLQGPQLPTTRGRASSAASTHKALPRTRKFRAAVAPRSYLYRPGGSHGLGGGRRSRRGGEAAARALPASVPSLPPSVPGPRPSLHAGRRELVDDDAAAAAATDGLASAVEVAPGCDHAGRWRSFNLKEQKKFFSTRERVTRILGKT